MSEFFNQMFNLTHYTTEGRLFSRTMPTLMCLGFCILFHIIADFHLQGNLAEFKQKRWWKKNYPDLKYKKDYIWALLVHSFEWSMITFLPLIPTYYFIYIANFHTRACSLLVGIVLLNTMFHAIIDHWKANKLSISLIEDQVYHLFQIFISVGIVILSSNLS